ncbi:MAG: hypothetical protein AAF378_25880, partial [Cyanobacteria bacterium P01_A01_bin.84]
QIPWHSRVKIQQSDLYLQQQKLKDTSRFYYSFKHFFWFILSLEILVLTAIWVCLHNVYQYLSTEISLALLFFAFCIVVMWLVMKNSYVAVNEDALEVNINVLNNFTNNHIKWSEISKVKYYNLIIFKQFCIFSPHGMYGFGYTVINIFLIDKAKFKQAVIVHTEPNNPLHQAVIQYL